jgi:hypothetical protein
MTFEEMQGAWKSAENRGTTEGQNAAVAKLARQMVRRRRFERYWLAQAIVWLTLLTGLSGWAVASGRTALTQEWALLAVLGLPWGFSMYFLRRFLKDGKAGGAGERPVAAALEAVIAANRREATRLKWVGVLLAAMAPAAGVAVYQLEAAGKASPREAVSMALFFGGGLALAGAGVAIRYFVRLRPQRARAEALLAELAA